MFASANSLNRASRTVALPPPSDNEARPFENGDYGLMHAPGRDKLTIFTRHYPPGAARAIVSHLRRAIMLSGKRHLGGSRGTSAAPRSPSGMKKEEQKRWPPSH